MIKFNISHVKITFLFINAHTDGDKILFGLCNHQKIFIKLKANARKDNNSRIEFAAADTGRDNKFKLNCFPILIE